MSAENRLRAESGIEPIVGSEVSINTENSTAPAISSGPSSSSSSTPGTSTMVQVESDDVETELQPTQVLLPAAPASPTPVSTVSSSTLSSPSSSSSSSSSAAHSSGSHANAMKDYIQAFSGVGGDDLLQSMILTAMLAKMRLKRPDLTARMISDVANKTEMAYRAIAKRQFQIVLSDNVCAAIKTMAIEAGKEKVSAQKDKLTKDAMDYMELYIKNKASALPPNALRACVEEGKQLVQLFTGIVAAVERLLQPAGPLSVDVVKTSTSNTT